MTSVRKIEANRRNGRKSRGPTSIQGKRRARGNARKHGLNVPILADRKRQAEALKIARAFVGKEANDALLAQALIVAEIELELQRIRRARLAAIESAMPRPGAADPGAEEYGSSASSPTDQEAPLADAVIKALPTLRSIERYERRAYSRGNKALMRLNCLLLMAQSDSRKG